MNNLKITTHTYILLIGSVKFPLNLELITNWNIFLLFFQKNKCISINEAGLTRNALQVSAVITALHTWIFSKIFMVFSHLFNSNVDIC
jgi:hypothetical protein